MDPKIKLNFYSEWNECFVSYDGEELGSIENWTSLTEAEQIRKVKDLVDQSSNNDWEKS